MSSRFGPRTTRDAVAQPGADGEVGVPGDQRRDQRQQRGQVGGQVDVHVGEDVGVAGRPDLRSARPRPFCARCTASDLGDPGGQAAGDRPGRVGARVVGDGDPERVGEVRAQVRVEAQDAALEVVLLVVDRGSRRSMAAAVVARPARGCVTVCDGTGGGSRWALVLDMEAPQTRGSDL